MLEAVARLDGAFTLLAIHADQPGVVVGARRNSPGGRPRDEANYLGSDVAFIGHREHSEARRGMIVTITPDSVTVLGFDGTPAEGRRYHVDWDAAQPRRATASSFM